MSGTEEDFSVSSRDVAKGAGTTLLARLGAVIDIVFQPLYVWMFGLASYGIYAVLWSAVNLIENFADLGMTSALQRTVPQARTKQAAASALRAALVLGVGPCLVIAALVSAFAPAFVHIFNAAPEDAAILTQAIRLFIWALPLWALVEVATSALRAQRAFGPEIRLRLFWEQVVRFGVAGALWMAGFGTMSLFYAHLASLAIVAALSLRLVAQYYDMRLMFSGPFGDESARHTLWAGLAVLPSNIVARLFGDAPQIVLNAWIPGTAGATAAALFVIARKISSVVQLVRTAFSYVLAPLASHAAQSGDDSVQSIYGFATRVSLAVTLPLGVGLIAGAKPILSAFAPGAEVAVVALILLTMGRMVEAIAGNASPIQQVIGGYRGQIFGGLAGLAMSLVIVGLTMPQGGLNGISLAVCCGLSVSALLPMWQLSHYEKLHPFERPFGTVVLRSAIIAAIALGVGLVLSGLPIAIAIVAIVAVQLASIWLSLRAALPLEDRQALGKVGRVLRLS